MQKTEAIRFYQTATKLAKALGITPQAVYKWPEVVPLVRQYQLSELTGGRLKVVKVKK